MFFPLRSVSGELGVFSAFPSLFLQKVANYSKHFETAVCWALGFPEGYINIHERLQKDETGAESRVSMKCSWFRLAP